MNVIRTDGAQPGFRSNSELQNITYISDVTRLDIHLKMYHRVLTVRRSIVQNPFDKHQGGHISKQQDKEEQLWEKFKEQAGILLEIPKKIMPQ